MDVGHLHAGCTCLYLVNNVKTAKTAVTLQHREAKQEADNKNFSLTGFNNVMVV